MASPEGTEGNEAPLTGPPAAEAEGRDDSVGQFIAVAKDRLPLERVRGDVRVTPRGLFVHKDSLDVLVDCYRSWFHEVAPHATDSSEQRVLKRMFGTATPPLYYLIEQKRALVGHLIAAPVKNPQALGLPVYLGSLEDGAEQIHPRDPLLQCMPQLSVAASAGGLVFTLQLASPLKGISALQFSVDLVRTFGRLASGSRVLQAKLPGERPALRDVLRVMLEVLAEARSVHADQRLLLPWDSIKHPPREVLFVEHLYFIVQENGRLGRVFEREGRNLAFFLRQEFAGIAGEQRLRRIRDFEVSRNRSDHVGRFRFFGKDYPLAPHACLQFVKSIARTAPDPEHLTLASTAPFGAQPQPRRDPLKSTNWTRFSVVECLELMSEVLLRAEHVDFFRVERFLPPGRRGHFQYRALGRWIFVLDPRSVVVECLDKLSPPKDRGASGNGDGSRGEGGAPRRSGPGRGRRSRGSGQRRGGGGSGRERRRPERS